MDKVAGNLTFRLRRELHCNPDTMTSDKSKANPAASSRIPVATGLQRTQKSDTKSVPKGRLSQSSVTSSHSVTADRSSRIITSGSKCSQTGSSRRITNNSATSASKRSIRGVDSTKSASLRDKPTHPIGSRVKVVPSRRSGNVLKKSEGEDVANTKPRTSENVPQMNPIVSEKVTGPAGQEDPLDTRNNTFLVGSEDNDEKTLHSVYMTETSSQKSFFSQNDSVECFSNASETSNNRESSNFDLCKRSFASDGCFMRSLSEDRQVQPAPVSVHGFPSSGHTDESFTLVGGVQVAPFEAQDLSGIDNSSSSPPNEEQHLPRSSDHSISHQVPCDVVEHFPAVPDTELTGSEPPASVKSQLSVASDESSSLIETGTDSQTKDYIHEPRDVPSTSSTAKTVIISGEIHLNHDETKKEETEREPVVTEDKPSESNTKILIKGVSLGEAQGDCLTIDYQEKEDKQEILKEIEIQGWISLKNAPIVGDNVQAAYILKTGKSEEFCLPASGIPSKRPDDKEKPSYNPFLVGFFCAVAAVIAAVGYKYVSTL